MYEDLKQNEQDKQETETPHLGGYNNTADSLEKKLPKLRVRYGFYNLASEDDLQMLESTMTKSLQCQDDLVDPGDIRVVSEEGTFNKDGEYCVAIKYLEVRDD